MTRKFWTHRRKNTHSEFNLVREGSCEHDGKKVSRQQKKYKKQTENDYRSTLAISRISVRTGREKKYFVFGDDDDKRHVYRRATTGEAKKKLRKKIHNFFPHTQLSTTSFHPSSDAESFSENENEFWHLRRSMEHKKMLCWRSSLLFVIELTIK